MKVKCPTCKTTATWEDNQCRPFCSEKCRLLDLGKWLNEEYTIKSEDEPMSSDIEGEPLH